MGKEVRCAGCGNLVEKVCSNCWRCDKCCKCGKKGKREMDGYVGVHKEK